MSALARSLCWVLCVIGFCTSWMGCGASHQSEDAAREEVRQQEELRKSQEAEEAALNADLQKGEK